jgi:hypothetical protein
LYKKSLEERENFSDHISLINTFYDEMHYELNKKNNKKTEKNYQSGSLQDLIFKCRDDFGNDINLLFLIIFILKKLVSCIVRNVIKILIEQDL